jgi:hypothetical protein
MRRRSSCQNVLNMFITFEQVRAVQADGCSCCCI